MANNRLFLVCKVCGKGLMLASHLGGPWETSQRSTPHVLRRNFDTFFSKHEECFFTSFMAGDDEIYELKYELSMTSDEWERCHSME